MSGISLGSFAPPPRPDSKPRVIPPATPIRFPKVEPKSTDGAREQSTLVVTSLQSVHRPADLNLSHFESLNIHVISDASHTDIIPWEGFLPPVEEWSDIPQDALLEANEATRKPLNNGNLSPGVQTYRERQKELLTDNTAAFRTIRRIPPPAGDTSARLGNAYEFFKNLELFSSYWPDTSLPTPSNDESSLKDKEITEPPDSNGTKENKPPNTLLVPTHLQTHVPIGNGAQLPPDHRTHLLHSFVKLVAYDFGCNVTFARTEPRLHLTPPAPTPALSSAQNTEHRTPSAPPPSYFNSSATFLYRTPTDRASARSGLVSGPLAAISSRASHTFASPTEEHLDFAREIVAILLTAQQRSRQHKTEKRFGENEWWTTRPRWGGGPGGPMGREADAKADAEAVAGEKPQGGGASLVTEQAKRVIGGINSIPSPMPSKRSKRNAGALPNGNMQIYENYRRLLPPSATWDRKCQYEAIGKVPGTDYDDIFLISGLNHHVCVVRARVPNKLVEVLEGGEEGEGWGRLQVWRSKWWDLYQASERIEAMGVVWGVVGWLMRRVEEEKMDLS